MVELAAVSSHRLRRELAADPDIRRVLKVLPLLQRLLLARTVKPTVTVEVVADSPGAAMRLAERSVARTLRTMGQPGHANAWIISTDGDRPSAL